MDKDAAEKFKKFVTGLGTIAEMSLIFYRAARKAGATPEEAQRLTQAYISAITFGGSSKGGEDE